MIRFWRTPSLFRESLAALICALVLLSGVVQARAGTEFAAKSGFVSTLALCQQKGLAGDAPNPDSECDHCRMPVPLAFAQVVPSCIEARFALGTELPAPVVAGLVFTRTILPEARGPPAQD